METQNANKAPVTRRPKKTRGEKTREKVLKSLRRATPKISVSLAGALILYVLTCAALLTPLLRSVPLEPGDAAPNTISISNKKFIPDVEATKRARLAAERAVERVYAIQPDKVERDAQDLFDTVLQSIDKPVNSQERIKDRERLLDRKFISPDTVDALLSMGKEEAARLHRKTVEIIRRTISGARRMEEPALSNLDKEVERVAERTGAGIAPEHMPLTKDIVKSLSWANSTLDRDETDRRRKAASSAAPVIKKKIVASKPIVVKGAILRPAQIERLTEIGRMPARIPWEQVGAGALLIMFVFAAIGAYLKNFSPRIYRDEKKMIIFYILILFAVVWALFVSEVSARETWFSPTALSIATGVLAILTCIILEPSAALLVAPLIALLVTLILKFELGVFFAALVAGLVGCFATLRRKDLDSILKAGLAISLSNIIAIAIITLANFESWNQAAIDILLFGTLNGLITAIWAAGLLPVFERTFNIVTPHRLLELSNPEHPLLKQLLINAPGTYHHCIFVGNLAETAAELVGADPLLVRTACFYHDVGKLKRPYFFVENQFSGTSLLTDISPTLGSLVISSHVRDGADMLREHGIPEDIVRIASEHHGTCLISFFYQQAKAHAKNADDVNEDRFRYPGPKPGTLESAIVMLADGCEASVRALKEITPRTIENQVNAIVKARIVDGQFDECDITLKQLDNIRKAFIRILVGVFHARMEYPSIEEELKRKAEAEQPARIGGGKTLGGKS